MREIFAGHQCALLVLALVLGLGAGPGFAADMEETPAADAKISIQASRACTDGCITDCRQERSACKDEKADDNLCRAAFQICARRCVVACSPR